MATKRRTPLTDKPPNPDLESSSSEEEEDDDDEEESSSAEEQPQPQPQPQPLPLPQPKPKSIPKPQISTSSSSSSSSEDEGPGSDDDEEKEQQNTNNKKEIKSSSEPDSPKSPPSSGFTIKPTPHLAATPVSKSTKRPAPAHISNSSNPKRPKPSSAVNRLWSDEDEIAVLEGLTEFKAKMGKDPSSNQGEFHEFMKELLSVEVSKNQLMDKVRRLKKKFNNNVGKSSDGEDPVLSKPHEYKSFLLSKRIWGKLPQKNDDGKVNANGTNVNVNADAKVIDADDRGVNKGEKSSGGSSRSAKKSKYSDKLVSDVIPVENDIAVKDLVKGKREKVEPRDGKEDDFVKLYPFVMNAVLSDKLSNILPELNVVRRNLSYVGSSKLKELDDEWKNVNMAEAEVLLKKMDLMRKQTKMVLDAMRSP